jgi:hypothetical protein
MGERSWARLTIGGPVPRRLLTNALETLAGCRLDECLEDGRVVDGRVKMARDQHREASKRFDIQSEFLVEPTSGQLLARATLTSEIYGTAVAHARVFLGGEGVNESNPIENGETSAVARALGMWGFGCFGTGIASADEVLRVNERPDSRGHGGAAPGSANGVPDPSAATTVAPDVPHDATEAELARLGQALGLRPGERGRPASRGSRCGRIR